MNITTSLLYQSQISHVYMFTVLFVIKAQNYTDIINCETINVMHYWPLEASVFVIPHWQFFISMHTSFFFHVRMT